MNNEIKDVVKKYVFGDINEEQMVDDILQIVKNEHCKFNYWVEGITERGYGDKGILLNCKNNRVLSVTKNTNGVTFREECDGEYFAIFSKEEALELVDELKNYIAL